MVLLTLLCDWSEDLYHPLNHSDARLKTIAKWSPAFSRASTIRLFFYFEFSLANDSVNFYSDWSLGLLYAPSNVENNFRFSKCSKIIDYQYQFRFFLGIVINLSRIVAKIKRPHRSKQEMTTRHHTLV